VFYFSNSSILYKMRFFTFLCCWGLAAVSFAQDYFYKWENAQTLRLIPFRCPLVDIKISQNNPVEITLEEFKWIDNKAVFLPCESEYSPQIRFRIKQGDKEMKIYGFALLLRKMQSLNNNGKKHGEKIPIINFQNGEFILNEETIKLARVENYTGQNFQRKISHFLQPNQQMGRDFVAMLYLHNSQNNPFQYQAPKTYFRNYPLDANSPLLFRQGENTSYGFFSSHNFNFSFGQADNKDNFWRNLLTKQQSFDLEKEAKLAHYDFSPLSINFTNYLFAIDAVAVEKQQLIGRIWDYNGNFFLIQSSPDWRKWEVIYTQKLPQDAASRMRVLGKNEILVSLTDNFLYGKLQDKKWSFEFINLDLAKKEGENFKIVDFEWAAKNDIRAVIQWGKNGEKTPEVEIIQYKNQKSKILLAGLSEFKSICYHPKNDKWVYACGRFIIQQKEGKISYYPIANQPFTVCLENDFAEIFHDLSRIQSYDSLKKIFPANQIQYILTQTYPSTTANELAAAYLDTAGNLYALMGDKQDKIARLEFRDDEYRAKDEFIFIQLLANKNERVAGAKVRIGQTYWKDTLLWDKNSQKMEAAYYLKIDKNAPIGNRINGNGAFNFHSFYPDFMEISHPDYQTATHLNSDISTLNWFVTLTSPDNNFSQAQLTSSYSPIKSLFLYKKEQLVTYFMGKRQPLNHFIENELVLVIKNTERPLRQALLDKIREFKLNIDSSDFDQQGINFGFMEKSRCPDQYHFIKLKKADSSNFDRWECVELAALRDTSLGVAAAGMRANYASQQLEVGGWERTEPNNNQIFITDYQPNIEPKLWEKRIQAAQKLGFSFDVQQSNQVLILSGAKNWTFRKLVQKAEELVSDELFKNCLLDVAMSAARSRCLD